MTDTPSRTALYDSQKLAGARFIDFGGWEMPVQFTSILDEHRAVRERCGVFDISHMGEVFVEGPAAFAWLQGLLANDLSKCNPGAAQYTFLLNESGGVIDDLIVYRLAPDRFLLLVNAAKIAEDVAWLREHEIPGAKIDDRSGEMSGLAVQGREAPAVFARVFGRSMPERNTFVEIDGKRGPLIAAGTGYTGEPGFELFCDNRDAPALWADVVAAGAQPCGLGARDTLRLEMCYPLNGSDLAPDRTPLEAGLGIFVALDKPEFIGRDALLAQKANGAHAKLAAIRMTEKSPPPRAHYPVLADGIPIGETCSGALAPSLGCGVAMAYLPAEFAKPGQPLEVDVRGKSFAAVVEKKPFYRASSPKLPQA